MWLIPLTPVPGRGGKEDELMLAHRWSHGRAHRLFLGAVCLGLGTGLVVTNVVPAAADDGGQYIGNYAVAFNSRDGSTRYDVDWRFASVTATDVTAVNRAYARARCNNCKTAAVAFEVVLVSGVSSLRLDNSSIALNIGCTYCDTAALAEQFVVASPGGVLLSPQGYAELQSLRSQFNALEGPGATPESIVAGAIGLEAQVIAVLSTDVQIVPLHPGDHEGYHIDHRRDEHED